MVIFVENFLASSDPLIRPHTADETELPRVREETQAEPQLLCLFHSLDPPSISFKVTTISSYEQLQIAVLGDDSGADIKRSIEEDDVTGAHAAAAGALHAFLGSFSAVIVEGGFGGIDEKLLTDFFVYPNRPLIWVYRTPSSGELAVDYEALYDLGVYTVLELPAKLSEGHGRHVAETAKLALDHVQLRQRNLDVQGLHRRLFRMAAKMNVFASRHASVWCFGYLAPDPWITAMNRHTGKRETTLGIGNTQSACKDDFTLDSKLSIYKTKALDAHLSQECFQVRRMERRMSKMKIRTELLDDLRHEQHNNRKLLNSVLKNHVASLETPIQRVALILTELSDTHKAPNGESVESLRSRLRAAAEELTSSKSLHSPSIEKILGDRNLDDTTKMWLTNMAMGDNNSSRKISTKDLFARRSARRLSPVPHGKIGQSPRHRSTSNVTQPSTPGSPPENPNGGASAHPPKTPLCAKRVLSPRKSSSRRLRSRENPQSTPLQGDDDQKRFKSRETSKNTEEEIDPESPFVAAQKHDSIASPTGATASSTTVSPSASLPSSHWGGPPDLINENVNNKEDERYELRDAPQPSSTGGGTPVRGRDVSGEAQCHVDGDGLENGAGSKESDGGGGGEGGGGRGGRDGGVPRSDDLRESVGSGDAGSDAESDGFHPATVTRDLVKVYNSWDFDCFRYPVDALEQFFVDMLKDFDLLAKFDLDEAMLCEFVHRVRQEYKPNPYHNFIHGFDVAHTVYQFLTMGNALSYLSDLDVLSLLVASLCHDVGHPGLNNAFQVAIGSELALLYNDKSVLENMHASLCFQLVNEAECQFLHAVDDETFISLRKSVVDAILHTDMAHHFEMVSRFESVVNGAGLDPTNDNDRKMLMNVILHSADISNVTKPQGISIAWARAVQEEFYRQGDEEKKFKLPISPFMDRDKNTLAEMTINFIDFIVLPLYSCVVTLFPSLHVCIQCMQENRKFWERVLERQLQKHPDKLHAEKWRTRTTSLILDSMVDPKHGAELPSIGECDVDNIRRETEENEPLSSRPYSQQPHDAIGVGRLQIKKHKQGENGEHGDKERGGVENIAPKLDKRDDASPSFVETTDKHTTTDDLGYIVLRVTGAGPEEISLPGFEGYQKYMALASSSWKGLKGTVKKRQPRPLPKVATSYQSLKSRRQRSRRRPHSLERKPKGIAESGDSDLEPGRPWGEHENQHIQHSRHSDTGASERGGRHRTHSQDEGCMSARNSEASLHSARASDGSLSDDSSTSRSSSSLSSSWHSDSTQGYGGDPARGPVKWSHPHPLSRLPPDEQKRLRKWQPRRIRNTVNRIWRKRRHEIWARWKVNTHALETSALALDGLTPAQAVKGSPREVGTHWFTADPQSLQKKTSVPDRAADSSPRLLLPDLAATPVKPMHRSMLAPGTFHQGPIFPPLASSTRQANSGPEATTSDAHLSTTVSCSAGSLVTSAHLCAPAHPGSGVPVVIPSGAAVGSAELNAIAGSNGALVNSAAPEAVGSAGNVAKESCSGKTVAHSCRYNSGGVYAAYLKQRSETQAMLRAETGGFRTKGGLPTGGGLHSSSGISVWAGSAVASSHGLPGSAGLPSSKGPVVNAQGSVLAISCTGRNPPEYMPVTVPHQPDSSAGPFRTAASPRTARLKNP